MTNIHKRVITDIQSGVKNLKREFGIYICPEEDNYYMVHFILPGPEDTPYEGGLYHGMIRLNNNHPFGAPNIHMITPSGRFIPESYPIPSGSRGICTTATAFHPETWTPVNNIETVLKGFISLMCDPFDGGVGGMKSTDDQTRKFAKASIDSIKSELIIRKLFPELYESLTDGTYQPIKLGKLCPDHQNIPMKPTEKDPNGSSKDLRKPVKATRDCVSNLAVPTASLAKNKVEPENLNKKKLPGKKSIPKTKTTKKKVVEESEDSESESESESESNSESVSESSESDKKPKKKKSAKSSKKTGNKK